MLSVPQLLRRATAQLRCLPLRVRRIPALSQSCRRLYVEKQVQSRAQSSFSLLRHLLPPFFDLFKSPCPFKPSQRARAIGEDGEMDVNSVSFYPLLLDMLTDISEAHFVAVDLELSGVPVKQIRNDAGKPTLQERYLEIKEAAEKFQILQFGLTCVHQDVENSKYILKPYNIDLSPLIQERGIDVERTFSFHTGAVDFLLKVGFDLSRPFYNGVPYLSRDESKEARDRHVKRQDKSALADIQLKPTETESLAFLDRVRSDINAWVRSKKIATEAWLNIVPAIVPGQDADHSSELSRFEKRLVHQLVRAEYPHLVTISKRGFIQIVHFDQEREDKVAAERKREVNEKLNRQKGFRWVIEALLGSDLYRLDLRECAKDPVTGEHVFADMDEYKARFHRAHNLLRGNPRVIVGHNCFLDLIYIYRTFIGQLPDTVHEFQRKLHKLWPTIVDTKYMSTHNCGDINPVSSLEQIATQLSAQATPVVETDPLHKKYDSAEALHEAGYDSFLTAQIAIRLSSRLEREGAFIEPDGHANGATASDTDQLTTKAIAPNPSQASKPVTHNSTSKRTTTSSSSQRTHKVSASVEEKLGFTPSRPTASWERHGDPAVIATHNSAATDVSFTYTPGNNRKHRHRNLAADLTFKGGVPKFGTDFWRVYGNKLRVFGTEESVCRLVGEAGTGLGSEEEESGGVDI